jgi:Tfp pilus assembly PilM family ATPase
LFAKFMLRTPTTGWLGFDLGGAAVKVAQVVRRGGEYRLRAAAIVPRRVRWNPEELTAEEALSSADELRTAASLAAVTRCGPAAAVLPMTLCDAAQVVMPAGNRRDLRELTELVEAELHQSLAGHLLADWATPWDDAKRNIIAAPVAWSDQVSRDVAAGRWNCRTIDALPWALARAVKVAEASVEARSVIALDWGYNRATLCLIHQGVPALVRCLKNCAFQQTVAAVSARLRLPEADAERLLATRDAFDSASAAAELLAETLVEPIERLQSEIRRTLGFWQGQARGIKPDAIYLFGGGASLSGLASRLTSALEIDVQTWTLQAEDPSVSLPPAHLLGPAVAASALAWEDA